jgi:hypothetical protein
MPPCTVLTPAMPAQGEGHPVLADSARYRRDSDGYQEEEVPRWLEELLAADEDFETVATGADGLQPERREWQVNVRLDRSRYATLRAAADVYGTTPTALARMLLNRGSTAILKAHRAEYAMPYAPDEGG